MAGLMAGVGVVSCAMFFIPPESVWLMFALNLLVGLMLGPKSPLAFSMYADCADYTEWKTGRRATAMTFAAATFSQKLGGALEFWSAPQRGVSFRLSFALKLNPEPGDNDQAPQSTSTV